MKKVLGCLVSLAIAATSLCAAFSASAAQLPTGEKVVNDYNALAADTVIAHNSNEAVLKIEAQGVDGSNALHITPKTAGTGIGNLTFWGEFFDDFFGTAVVDGKVDMTKYDGFMFFVKNKTENAELSIQLNKVMYKGRGIWAHLGKGAQVFDKTGSDQTATILQPMGDVEYKFVFPANFEGWIVLPAKVADNKDDTTAGFYSKDGLSDVELNDVEEINFWGNEKTDLVIDNVTFYGGEPESSNVKPAVTKLLTDYNALNNGERLLITGSDSGKVFAKDGWLNFDRTGVNQGNFTFFQDEDMSLLFGSENTNGDGKVDISIGDGIMFDIKNMKDSPSQYIQLTADFIYMKNDEQKQYRQQLGFGAMVCR